MHLRAAGIATLVVAACHGTTAPADRGSAAVDDPWAPGAAPRAPSPPRTRKLALDGEIQGATPALLATRLPGYADPHVGDWRAFRHITTGNLGKPSSFHATAIAVVRAVTPATVTIELSGRLDETGEQRSDGADELPRAFTVEHEIHRQHGDWAASHVELIDDTRTLDGRNFACKKLSARFIDPLMPAKDTQVEVWLGTDVPAGGEVFQREVQKTDAWNITSTSELIGFGDATHTLWGKRPEGL